jgi:hypothetical protein
MGLTNHGKDRLLALFKDAGPYYVGLFATEPGEDGGVEISAGGYARQRVVFGTPSGGSMTNAEVIEFPTATADWGAASGFGLFDAEAGGNLVWYGAITDPKTLYKGDIYRVNAENLTLTMD